MNEMPTNKKSGFTLLEIIIALGIASIIITTTLGMVGSIYFSQKKLLITQDFFAESRFLMERMTQMIRNNTIDYDRYFIEVGPDDILCSLFDENQTPTHEIIANDSSDARAGLGYPNIFYWDTTEDGVQDRNLGGKVLDVSGLPPEDDPCAKAWNNDDFEDNPITTLYLINSARTARIAIRRNAETEKLEVQKQLSADLDNDGIGDLWGPLDTDGEDNDLTIVWEYAESERCRIKTNDNTTYDILGNEADEDFCALAHDWTVISPEQIEIDGLSFIPSPDRDPFLSFAVDDAQIHPLVFILLKAKLRNPEEFGLDAEDPPEVSLQTTASSRTFGNIRQ